MPPFRNRSLFRLPAVRIGPVVIAAAVCLLVMGLVTLAVINPGPQMRHLEVPISSDRFAR